MVRHSSTGGTVGQGKKVDRAAGTLRGNLGAKMNSPSAVGASGITSRIYFPNDSAFRRLSERAA